MADQKDSEMSVEFRYLGIPKNQGEIGGICLSYSSEGNARGLFEAIHAYITAPSTVARQLMSVDFHSRRAAYDLHLAFGVGDIARSIDLYAIESGNVQRLRQSLGVHSYYCLVAGFATPSGEFQLLSPQLFHLFKADLCIDGRTVTGVDACGCDWTHLFSES